MDQIDIINNSLRNIYTRKKDIITNTNNDNNNNVDMKPVYSEDEKFLFKITLDEFSNPIDKKVMIVPNNGHFSPHDVMYGIFKGDKKFQDVLNNLQYNSGGRINAQSISNIVTANIDKRIWYFQNDLVPTNYKIKTFVELSLSEMSKLLKSIPIPSICSSPSIYNVTDPKSFTKTVNSNDLKLFDFIPYVKNYTINDNIIKRNLVYKLADEIVLILFECGD